MSAVPPKERSRTAALVLSLFTWPGAGQLYLRRPLRGWVLATLTALSLAILFVQIYVAANAVVGPAIEAGNLDPFNLLDQVHAALPRSAIDLQYVLGAC